MQDLVNSLKFPLYRLIFNLPLGFGVLFVTCLIIGCDKVEKCMRICINIKPDSTLGVIVYTSLLIVVGEFLAMAGESVTGLFFDFNPLVHEKLMEKTSPFSTKDDAHKKCEDYIKYEDFVKVLDKAAGEISEIHFLWSRTLGGFGILFLFSSIALLSVEFTKSHYILCIFFVFYAIFSVFTVIAFISYLENPSIFKYIYNLSFVACMVLPIFLFFIIIATYVIYLSRNKFFISFSLVLLLLSVLSFLWSVKYRAFSNRINRSIIETNKDKRIHTNNN